MSSPSRNSAFQPAAVQAYLLGRIGLSACLELQERIAGQIEQRDDGQVAMLVCEHPAMVTIGRGGSAADLQAESGLLRQRRMEVRWVKRGGACLVHAPGQLAAYVVAPLNWHGWTVGEYLGRLQGGVIRAIEELRCPVHVRPGQYGLWGRGGQLAYVAIAVRNGVTRHGVLVNVDPAMGLFRVLETASQSDGHPSSLVAERRGPVKMTTVKTEVIRHLTTALGCDRYHLYTGHPWLRQAPAASDEPD